MTRTIPPICWFVAVRHAQPVLICCGAGKLHQPHSLEQMFPYPHGTTTVLGGMALAPGGRIGELGGSGRALGGEGERICAMALSPATATHTATTSRRTCERDIFSSAPEGADRWRELWPVRVGTS